MDHRTQAYVDCSPGAREMLEREHWVGAGLVALLLAIPTLGISLILAPVLAHRRIKAWRRAATSN